MDLSWKIHVSAQNTACLCFCSINETSQGVDCRSILIPLFLCKGSCIRKVDRHLEKGKNPQKISTFHATMGTALEDFNATQFTVYSPK
jgi:hypothetical protein